jgi:hypothetical protein
LEFVSVHSIAFGGVHENIVVARGGSLISRIHDFERQLAEFGFVVILLTLLASAGWALERAAGRNKAERWKGQNGGRRRKEGGRA